MIATVGLLALLLVGEKEPDVTLMKANLGGS